MSDPFPAPIYAETVLAHNFEDAKKYFLGALLEVHYAHTRMLAGCGLLNRDEENKLLAALHGLDRERIAAARFDGTSEDLFFFIEGLLEETAGRALAGKMHTARSRNDIAVTLYRMAARREILGTAAALAELRAVLLKFAAEHVMTIMPAHTHTQPAQPTTLAHYLLAGIEFLARDAARLQAAFARVNLSPMGAAAITTSGFPIDRDATARLLGFDGLAENSYGAIAAIDYITETAAVVAVAMVNIGKLVQDLLLWSTREFGYLRLADAFVQTSSIMPQKRNPVALEHVRILASRALGEAQAVLTCAQTAGGSDCNRTGRYRSHGRSRTAEFPDGNGTSRHPGPPRRPELSRGPRAGSPGGSNLWRTRRSSLAGRSAAKVPSRIEAYGSGNRTVSGSRILRAGPDGNGRPSSRADFRGTGTRGR
jgi:argininosuccinate lyase